MQISYGSGLIVYTFNAEVVQSYAEFARRLHPDAICTAYVNGMIGYISDAKETVEGGYEPAGSAPYFALAGTYSIETEVLIHDAIQDLYKNNNHTI